MPRQCWGSLRAPPDPPGLLQPNTHIWYHTEAPITGLQNSPENTPYTHYNPTRQINSLSYITLPTLTKATTTPFQRKRDSGLVSSTYPLCPSAAPMPVPGRGEAGSWSGGSGWSRSSRWSRSRSRLHLGSRLSPSVRDVGDDISSYGVRMSLQLVYNLGVVEVIGGSYCTCVT